MSSSSGSDFRTVFRHVPKDSTRKTYADYLKAVWGKLHGARSDDNKAKVPDHVLDDLNWAVDEAPEIAAVLRREFDGGQTNPTAIGNYAQRVLSLNRHFRKLDPHAIKVLKELSDAGTKARKESSRKGSTRVTDAHPTVRDLRDNYRVLDALLGIVNEHGGIPRQRRERLANAHIIYGFLATNADVLAIRINELINLPLWKTDEGNYLDTRDNVLVLREHKTDDRTGTRTVYLHPSFAEVMRKSLAFFPRDKMVTCTKDTATRAVKRFFFVPETKAPNMMDIREIVITNNEATRVFKNPVEHEQFIKNSGTSQDHTNNAYNLGGPGYGEKVFNAVRMPHREEEWVKQRAREAFFEVFS